MRNDESVRVHWHNDDREFEERGQVKAWKCYSYVGAMLDEDIRVHLWWLTISPNLVIVGGLVCFDIGTLGPFTDAFHFGFEFGWLLDIV